MTLFSKRQKKLRGEASDIYIYDKIPQPLRVQVVHIWNDSLGEVNDYENAIESFSSSTWVEVNYRQIVEYLCREYGVFELFRTPPHCDRNYYLELTNFLLTEENAERVLDAVEFSFQIIQTCVREFAHTYKRGANGQEIAANAVRELNHRFQEHGIGFSYENGQIIRKDSELIHKEIIKPTLELLHSEIYTGAEEEFLKAHEHYRHGRTKEALVEALKSLESTLKVVCKKKKWPVDPKAGCGDLIKVCFEKGLIPDFWQNHFNALRTTLESGVPTGRNKLGGHGQGEEIIEVPKYIAAYVLHLTASAIVLVVEAEKAL